jgi:hypothetical protein
MEKPNAVKSRSWCRQAPLQREQLLRPLDPSESVPADGDQSVAVFGRRGSRDCGGHQDVLLDGAAQSSDAARLVDRRSNDREIKAILASDIAVEDLADVKSQDVGLAVRGAPLARNPMWLPAVEQSGEGLFLTLAVMRPRGDRLRCASLISRTSVTGRT